MMLQECQQEQLTRNLLLQQKSWMTADLFRDLIQTVNHTMRHQRRNFLMFLNKASSHSEDV